MRASLRVAIAVGDAAVHVREDLGVAAGAHLLDAPRHDRRREVVEQHAVCDLAGEAQHLLVQRGEDDLRFLVAEPQPEPEARHAVEVAVEAHGLAREAFAQQGDELAHLRERSIAVSRAMPLAGDGRRRDPDAEEDVAVARELLQGRAGHRVQAAACGAASASTPVPSPAWGAT